MNLSQLVIDYDKVAVHQYAARSSTFYCRKKRKLLLHLFRQPNVILVRKKNVLRSGAVRVRQKPSEADGRPEVRLAVRKLRNSFVASAELIDYPRRVVI